jgi:hypothetical protein
MMAKYTISGPKQDSFKSYHTLHYAESLLNDLNEEDLLKYNYAMALIYKWLKIAIDARKKNVLSRLNHAKRLREEREQKIEEERSRMEDRATKLAEAKDKHEVDNRSEIEKYNEYQAALNSENPPELEEGEDPPIYPPFDDKFFLFGYDEEHPHVEIPKEVTDDIDNDYMLIVEQKEKEIGEYNVSITEHFLSINAPPETGKRK